MFRSRLGNMQLSAVTSVVSTQKIENVDHSYKDLFVIESLSLYADKTPTAKENGFIDAMQLFR